MSPLTEKIGKVFQSTRIKGTFYQDFKYGSLIPTAARSLALTCAARYAPLVRQAEGLPIRIA